VMRDLESGKRRATLQELSGWTVEREDCPEVGTTKWTAVSPNGETSSWQFMWFGRELQAEKLVHPSWSDFWTAFGIKSPENVEPYSKLHPDFIGFLDYSECERGVCTIHLLAMPQPTEEQLRELLQAWRSLEARGDARPGRR